MIATIVDELKLAGLSLRLQDDNTNVLVSPVSRITPEIHEQITKSKQEIIDELVKTAPPTELTFDFSPERIVPKSELAIVVFIIGKAARLLAKRTLRNIQHYAHKCGADLIVISDDQCPKWPIGNKLRFGSIAKHYRRSLLLDVDIWVHQKSPNIFKSHSSGIWMQPDVFFVKKHGFDYLTDELELLAEQHSLEVICRSTKQESKAGRWFDPPKYCPMIFNTGVILLDQVHAAAWRLPERPLKLSHTAEQAWIDLMLSNQFHIQRLESKWNWVAFGRNFQSRIKQSNFVHLANCTHSARVRMLRKLEKERIS